MLDNNQNEKKRELWYILAPPWQVMRYQKAFQYESDLSSLIVGFSASRTLSQITDIFP